MKETGTVNLKESFIANIITIMLVLIWIVGFYNFLNYIHDLQTEVLRFFCIIFLMWVSFKFTVLISENSIIVFNK